MITDAYKLGLGSFTIKEAAKAKKKRESLLSKAMPWMVGAGAAGFPANVFKLAGDS